MKKVLTFLPLMETKDAFYVVKKGTSLFVLMVFSIEIPKKWVGLMNHSL